MRYRLRMAKKEELSVCEALIDDARAFQRAQGFVQWTDTEPGHDTLEEDMRTESAYLLEEINEDGGVLPVAYAYIGTDGEDAYEDIDGAWQTDSEPYATVHRVAVSADARGRGISAVLFEEIRALCFAKGIFVIRIDTMDRNKRMQHVLAREGFRYCGIVRYDIGERLAYELVLSSDGEGAGKKILTGESVS